jgi:hypothetical protein
MEWCREAMTHPVFVDALVSSSPVKRSCRMFIASENFIIHAHPEAALKDP